MTKSSLIAAILGFAVCTPVCFAKTKDKASPLPWETLGELDYKKGIATAKLKTFDSKVVRVAGFIVPLDFSESREVGEFLLTPSYPGCIHVPPPTPAQTIYVKMEKGSKAKMSWGPVWVTGKLKLVLEKKTGYGEASFEMTGLSTAEYDPQEEGDKLVNLVLGAGGLPTSNKPVAK